MKPRQNTDRPNQKNRPAKKFVKRTEAPRNPSQDFKADRPAAPNTEGRKIKVMGLHPDVTNN